MKNVEDLYPLTPLQKGMLFHTLLAPESAVYVSQLTCTLPADLDPGRFRQAWETLVRRHGVLRTAFLWEGLDEPLQAVRKTVSVPWQELDWRGLSEDGQERRFTDLCHRERHTPFSLARAPLLRFSLIHLGRRTGFVWTVHHLLLDGWSLPLLVRELTIVYAALREGREPALPPVRPFGDYVAWLKKQNPARAEPFWREELAGFTAPNALGIDRPARAHGASGYAEHGLQISREATARLQTLASQHRLTLQTVTLGAWAVLMSRYSGDEDVVFGNVVSGRPAALPGVETMVGMFINTLPVRARVNGAELLAPWLQRLQERQVARREFEQAPLAEIQRWSEVPAGSPLFETLYVFENYPNAGAGGSNGLRIGDLRSFESTNYPITLTLTAADHVYLRLAYDRARMDENSALRLLGHLGRLLAGIGERPEQALRDLSFLSEAELHQLRAEWSDTASFFPQEAPLHGLFAEQAEQRPEAVAVEQGEESLTCRELGRRAERLARWLVARGLRPEERVAVAAERSPDLIVALLGILQAGGAYLPLDPADPPERRAWMIRDAGASLLSLPDGPEGEEPAVELPQVPAESLAYVMYTSGSTGAPKGVAVTHRNVVRLVRGAGYAAMGPEQTWLQYAPVSFDASTLEIWASLLNGGRLVLFPGRTGSLDDLARVVESRGVTSAWLTAGLFHEMVDGCLEGLKPLRQLLTGGDVVSAEHARRALAAHPGLTLIDGYGPTEGTTFTSCHVLSDPHQVGESIPVGRPIANARAWVVDRSFAPVPMGVWGELCVGGEGLARGYLDRPDLTAERFVPDPCGAVGGERLYRTGDLVRWRTDGILEFSGRIDHQVKLRGFRIEPGEIEAALVALPGVREAVVVAREDVPGDRRLVAYVVGNAPVEELRRSLRGQLPGFMVPSAFVTLAALPLTPNGKVDRKALLSPGAAPEPQSSGESHVAPRTPVEEVLAGIWAEVLGRERVGVADSFFGLGGHSLLATRVTSRLRKAFGVELPLRDLFETATLAELATRVEMALRAGAGALAPPLTAAAPRQGPQPLSFAQQRLWFIDRLEPGGALYNIPVVLRVEGPLRVEVLRRILSEIVRRHEALRTVFAVSEGGEGSPVQVVQPAAPFELPEVDLSGLSESRRETAASALAGEEAGRPFDLTRDPMLRCLLLRLAPPGEPADHVLALTLHHIAGDGWSMGILVREVAVLYAALAEDTEGRPSPLPELPVQYADFAVWQRSWLQGEVLEREIAYWKQHLAGLPPLLSLPADRPRPAVQSFRGAGRPVRLPAGLTRQLEALARREGATLFMVLLAGFEVLLARTSGQEDLAVGSPIAGRNREEIEGLIGFFVNTLVLRGQLTGGPSFRELLARVRETALAAYVHQDVPFEKLVEELAPERSLARSPLFQVMFALQNAPVESLEIRGLQLRPVSGVAATVKFDLELDLQEQDGGLSGMVGYATDLFDGATIDRLIGHFERTLAAALATPELPVAALLFLTGAERHQLLVEWNDTETRSLPGCLHHDVAAQAARTPAAVAVEMGIEHWTYRRLIGSARRLARHLRVLGIGPDVVVGLCGERSPALVVGMLAVLEAGGAWLPLDPGDPAERLAFMLKDSGAQVLLIQKHLMERVPAAGLPVVLLDGSWDCGEEMGEALGVEVSPDHLAYVIYTSGSTGQPKGVMVPHRGVRNRLRWAKQVYGLDERDAFLHKAASSVDVSVWECFAPLVAGARLVLAEPGRQGESAYLIRTIREHRVTLVDFVPSMLAVFLDEAEVETCVSLRQVFVGGEALGPELRDRMAARLPIPLDNMYGPTEITIDTTRWVCAPGVCAPGPHRVPIGRPIGNSRLYVVDRELRPLPLGVSGELVVGGEGVTRGYLGRPGLSAERFVPDPFGGRPGGRLYRTGDLARCRADGAIEFLGRLDHQVKIRGVRIELGEIEAALRLHPAVHDAVADVRSASAFELLTAWAVPREGSAIPAAADLRAFLRERLPDSMVPAAFVALAALPLTPGGKVDRKALPAPGRPGSGDLFVAPRTPVEELLAAIWSDVLGRDLVGVADSFFDLGGHSLLATQLMSRLRRTFGVEMPLRDLFAAPRLADLAVRVEAALAAGTPQAAPPLVRIAPALRQGPQPLSFAQQRLWFIDQLEPGSALYNMPVALRVEGPLRCEVLRLTLGEIVRRHEALRTVFAAPAGSPVQVVQAAAPFELPVVDLSGLPESRRETAASALAGEEAGRPFDLTRDLMLHCLLLRLAHDDHAVLLTLHHIASDGWSTGILVREVAVLYAALAEDTAGRPSPLPELPVQYADFAVWQRSWLQGEALERELAYWRRELAGLPPLLELPTDRPRPAVQSYRGATRPARLPAGLTGQLEALARREGATLFMVLLAGFQALLARTGGQEDLAVGSPIAGRNRVEIEGLIGFFVNTLVMRGDLTGGPSFRELLGRVRETALAAYVHQDVPFEKLVEELAPERSLAHAPLFQVMLVLQNAPVENLEIQDLSLRPMASFATTAKFDLTLSLEERNGDLFGTVDYATDLFDGTTIHRLILQYERLLTAAVAAPERMVSVLPLLGEAERQQVLVEWNDTQPIRSPAPSIPERFFAAAATWPEAEALRLGPSVLTYGELGSRVRRRAAELSARGVGPETVTALFLDRSFEMVEAVLAVLATGSAFVALDPRSTDRVLASLLEQVRPRCILVQEHFFGRLPSRSGVDVLTLNGGGWTGGTGPGLPVPADPDSLAYVSFTSGSTGVPKGILGVHGAVARYLEYLEASWPLALDDRVLQLARLSFDASIRDLLYPLTRGAGVVLLTDEEAQDPGILLREVRTQGVTHILSAVPSLLHVLVESAAPGEGGGTLRLVLASGEPLPLALCRRVREVFGEAVQIANQYGPSECTLTSTMHQVPRDTSSVGMASAGRPIPGMRCHVLDSFLQEVPIGITGQVFLGGASVTRGYLNRPDLTAERFLPDPFFPEEGARLYATGDLGRRRWDGTLELQGRLDHQVKIRGIRLELEEVEVALAAHPAVETSVAVVRDGRLLAYVVDRSGPSHANDLRRFLADCLPEHAVPSLFVHLEALPLNANGKVDRKALPAPEWQGSEERYVAPRTPVEEVLAGIWAEVLGRDRVGAADSFFDLGGHSLLATRVMSRLRRAFGVEMPLRDLFATPRLADLAVRVEAALAAGTPAAPPLVRIAPALRQGPQPLSFAQQRLWFIDQLEPGSALYNMPVALRVEGPLRIAVLRLVLSEIVRRHEALRTVFAVSEGGEGSPVQVVQPAAPVALPVVDLSGLPEKEREALAAFLAGEEGGRPFDLGDFRGDPLLRCLLLRLAHDDHAVLLTMHHIASDDWSMGILVREVAALYAAFAAGRPSPLPELPVQYADFAVWQRSWLQGEVLESEIADWKQHLAGLPPLLALPTDRPRPAVQSFRGASRPVRLPAELTRQAQALARGEGATLFMVLLAGFQALLARSSGQEDLAVGSPVAGRNRMEIEGLIGFFVNTLVLRGDLTRGPSFRELLGRVRETALAAYVHQDVPFEKLVEELAPERSLAHAPLFQVMLVLQNAPTESLEVQDLRLRPMSGVAVTVKFDLELDLQEQDGELSGTVRYATDLFDGATIDRLIGHFERTLAAALATPELPVAALLLLTRAEQHQLLVEWNDTETRSLPGCLHHDVAAQAARTPAAVAVEMGDERWTYRRLAGSARRLARHLRTLGVGPDVVVGLCVERSPAMVVGMLAVLEAGGAWLPLDPGDPVERLAFMLKDSGAQVLLIQKHLMERVPAAGLPVALLDGSWDAGEEMGEALEVEVSQDHLAYVIYTSGSTGQPKGVMVPHRGVCNRLRWAKQVYGIDERDAFLHKAASSVDVSVWECFAPLIAGARLVLAEPGRQGESAYLIRTICEHRVTLVDFVPALLAAFLTEQGVEDCTSLRQIFAGGEALSPELRDRALARLSIPLDNMYGPTEISIDTTRWVCRPGQAPHTVPIGWPIDGSRLYVVDRELRPVAIGVAGELLVGGAGVTRGYLRQPGLTAERYVPDPFGAAGGRLYRTGDLARRLPDGALDFIGRVDDQVKIRGIRIELGEIEAALLALPGIRETVVLARLARSGDPRLVAYVVGDAAADARALREHLRERLPNAMIPAAFVPLPALPLLPSGKLDRGSLPEPEPPGAAQLHVPPRTPVEQVLAGIWAGVLGLEWVGADGHFFELGGHSLLATQVLSRLRRTFGIELPLRDLFEAPMLADLAVRVEAALRALRSGTAAPVPPLVRVPRQGLLPLSFAQQRLWFIDQLTPGSPLYNMPVALRVEGPLRVAVLRCTLSEIVRRHEALRTVFAAPEGSPVQVVQPAAPFELPVVDLSGLPESRRETAATALAGEEAGRPFDLTRDLMLHCLLLRLAPPGETADHVLALTMHHIASDGWSMGILVREITALYAAFAAGRPLPLPELPLQYGDFAVWQHSWLHGEALERELAYWRQQLAGLPPLLELPTDRPRPAVQSYRGATRPVRLPAGLTGHMEALARREGATLFMVLLAGFQALLARTSGQDDLAVGSPIAGRNRVEIEGLIGFFVNTLVLRGHLTGSPSFRELLGRVRETALAAYVHQDVPFEKLVEELAPERSLAHAPLFQVMLVLQNAPTESLEVRDLRLRPVSLEATTSKFDLTLNLAENEEGLLGAIEHATHLFDAATIDRLMAHYELLLAGMVEDPERGVHELDLLTAEEALQLRAGSETATCPLDHPLHTWIENQAGCSPDAVAINFEAEALTYRELDRQANRLARHLLTLEVGCETRVAVLIERSPELVVALLAILKAGGAYVPLDLAYPAERIAFLLDDSAAAVLLTEEHLAQDLPHFTGRIVRIDADRERIAALSAERLAGTVEPAHLAYIIYTSGSTGRPKGVQVTHANVLRLFAATRQRFGFGPADVWTFFHSVAFDFSVWEIWGALLHGARLVIVPWHVSRSPELFLDLLVREQVTVLNQTPSAFTQLSQEDEKRGGVPTDLRLVIFGGEALDLSGVALWLARHGDEKPLLVNMYGITETTVHVTARPLRAMDAQDETRSLIGFPIPGLSLTVTDPRLRPVPLGVLGELAIGGAGLARGYLGRPELTAERFVPDPLGETPGARLYRSGDLGRLLSQGDVEYLGRIDDQVKIRGFRIELGEIEAALVALPEVREAVVVVREERSGREAGDRRLVAYVVGDSAMGSEAVLRQALRKRLPDYMVPASFVMLPALPLTPNGKVDRKALPAAEPQGSEESYVAPRTPVEEILAGIWAEVLGRERIGASDHFFDLGGHSLLATQVMSRLHRTFGVEMPLRDLFETPALADFAARIETALRAGTGSTAPPLVPVPREGPLPLSFAQQRLWFLYRLEPESSAFHLGSAVRLTGALLPGALAASLGEIVRRHEVLRTRYRESADGPVQIVDPAAPFPLPVIDLGGLPEDVRERELHRLADREEARPFDLTRSWPLRARLVCLARDEHAILFTLHHIAGDGWSMGLLTREVGVLYARSAGEAAGSAPALPELPVQYGDYAVWQRGWLSGERLETQLDWWRERLRNPLPVLELPQQRERPDTPGFRGAACSVAVPAALRRTLEETGRREGATLFMVLLAGLKALLHTYSGQEDLIVGTNVANRDRSEIEGLIGFFVNNLALRTDLSGAPTFRELVRRVRDVTLGAFAHQEVPFEKVLEAVQPRRQTAFAPLFQVLFVLQRFPALSWPVRGQEAAPLGLETRTANFDLTLAMWEEGGGMAGSLIYDTGLFAEAAMPRMAEHFQALLQGVAEDPDQPLSAIPLATEADVQQLASDFSEDD